MSQKKYLHKKMIRDFSLNEVANGLEKALEQFQELEQDPIDDLLRLRGTWKNPADPRYIDTTEMLIDEEHGELVETYCSCRKFQEDMFSCEHICTLLGRYMLQEEGAEGLYGTVLYQKLQEFTGVEDPFQPDVLKKTDFALQAFMKATTDLVPKNRKPQWLIPADQKTMAGMISIEVILYERQGMLGLELKAGPKRRYVIRNLERLASAYQKNEIYAFSNSVSCNAGRKQYLEKDRPIMDMIAKLCIRNEKGILGQSLYYNTGGDYCRQLRLTGRDMDAFMEALEGRQVTVDSGYGEVQEYQVDFSKNSAGFTLTGTEYGAKLTGTKQKVLACGMDWMYLCQDNVILRMPSEQWEQRSLLTEAFDGKSELYIQNKDIPAVYQGLLRAGLDETSLTVQNLELASYGGEIPKILIYLDHPQDDLISCEVKARYQKDNTVYNVLDQRRNKKNRNIAAEQEAGEQIWPYFTAFDEKTKQMYLQCDDMVLYQFVTETIPALSEIGEVFISDQLKRLKVRPAGEVSVGLQVDAGSLVMSLHSNTMSKDEMIEVLSAYRSKKKFTRLKNGEFIVMPEGDNNAWDVMAETYKNYGRKNPEAMKIPLFRALYLQEGLKDREDLQVEEGDNYTLLVRELQNEEEWDYQIPDTLAEVLRDYQKDGFRWMKMLKKNGFGGILADDMGLGKTLQVLTFLLSEKLEGNKAKSLIVAPASLIYNWKKETEKFTPELSCRIIAGTIAQRRMILQEMRENPADLYITSYDLIKRDISLYEGIHFDHQFIDEAQYIKNQSTQVAKAVRLIDSGFRMALTGTPIENRLSELWSIFDYLMPGFLYSYARFRSEFETPVINDHDEVVMARLRSMVHPFILRRLKKDVLKDLPDKMEEVITVNLEGEQRKLYDAYAERLRLSLDKSSDEEFHQRKLEILAELTRLRQICCGPNLFLEGYKGENAKKAACLDLIQSAIDSGHKVLLFSQFTSVLDDLGKSLQEQQISYHRIDGGVSKEERMRQVESFASDEVPLFLISLKAGGTGLNLTAADIVIHYDPWWNIAAQNQATDRTHRIGQENTVTVYQLIAEKTIEEQMANLQKTKAQLAEDILSGEGIASIMIDKSELLRLL